MPGSTRYHAPSVSYPVGRCVFAGLVLVLLCLLLLGALALAVWQGADPREHGAAMRFVVLGLIGWLGVAAWAARHWLRSAEGRLLWRDGAWHWWPDGQADPVPVAALKLAWDGQGVLLLRLEGVAPQARWLWLERRRDGTRWDDLRRAVWAAQGPPGGQ